MFVTLQEGFVYIPCRFLMSHFQLVIFSAKAEVVIFTLYFKTKYVKPKVKHFTTQHLCMFASEFTFLSFAADSPSNLHQPHASWNIDQRYHSFCSGKYSDSEVIFCSFVAMCKVRAILQHFFRWSKFCQPVDELQTVNPSTRQPVNPSTRRRFQTPTWLTLPFGIS